jgi:hypothetical protein
MGSGFQALAETWDGTSWLVQSPTSPLGGILNSVACTSGIFCLAVGGSGSSPLAETQS